MAKGYCLTCGIEIEVNICCNGYMCGCQGQPTEPPFCSQECYDEYIPPTRADKFIKLDLDDKTTNKK